MAKVLHGEPDKPYPVPEGIISVKINPDTGHQTYDEGGIDEYFYQEYPPPEPDPLFELFNNPLKVLEQLLPEQLY